jgi:3-oxoadipate enol-lactonase
MHYTERGDGPTVIALHPATVTQAEMGWISATLVHEGYNVVMPDQRGHGATPNPAPDMHLSRMVDDLLEFSYRLGRSPLHGIGYSMGGAVLLYAAARQPDLFRSLALLSTNYRAPSSERTRQVVGPPDQQPDPVRRVFDPVNGIAVGWDAPPETFRAIYAPTLILTGDRDEFHDPGDNLLLYHALPQASLLVVPRTGHFDIVRHPIVMAALREFYGRALR